MARNRLPQEYISRADTASLLGMSTRAVDLAIADGRLKAYRFGRTVRLLRTEVEAALVPISAA
jgi:excisionase family DNA binding protein